MAFLPVRLAIGILVLPAAARLCADPLPPPPAPLGRQIEVQPPSNYAKIDVTSTQQAMTALMQGTTAEQEALANDIRANAANYSPPVFYVLAAVMQRNGHIPEALFWAGAGEIRARYDIARCADPTVADTAQALAYQYTSGWFGAYVRIHPDALDRATKEALFWDQTTAFHYDCRWINLHGMGAFGVGGHELSKPEADWPALHAQARQEFLESRQRGSAMIRTAMQRGYFGKPMPETWGQLVPIRSAAQLAGAFGPDDGDDRGFERSFPVWPNGNLAEKWEFYPTGSDRALVIASGRKGECGRGETSILRSGETAVLGDPNEKTDTSKEQTYLFRNEAGDLIIRRDERLSEDPQVPVNRTWARGRLLAKIDPGATPPALPPDLTPAEAVAAADKDSNGIAGIFRFTVKRVGAQNGRIYLDSEKDYRDPACLVVELAPNLVRLLPALNLGDPQSSWTGKTLRVQGTARNVKILLYRNGLETGDFYYQTQIRLATLSFKFLSD